MKDLYAGRSETPDYINPYLGIRAWRIQRNQRGQERLTSIYKPNIRWPITRRLEADCIRPFTSSSHALSRWLSNGMRVPLEEPQPTLGLHDAPFNDCSCGIYALNQIPESEKTPWTGTCIIGLAFLWGHVIEGTMGYRAQYGKVAALLVDPDRLPLIKKLARNYRVPLIADLAGEFARQSDLQQRTGAIVAPPSPIG